MSQSFCNFWKVYWCTFGIKLFDYLELIWGYGVKWEGVSSVQSFCRVQLLLTPWTASCLFPCPSPTPRDCWTHVHQVNYAIPPSHPLSFPSLPALNLSQLQGLFQWVSYSHQVANVLQLQFQYQSFRDYSGLISFRMDWLGLCSPRDSQESSSTPQYKSINY